MQLLVTPSEETPQGRTSEVRKSVRSRKGLALTAIVLLSLGASACTTDDKAAPEKEFCDVPASSTEGEAVRDLLKADELKSTVFALTSDLVEGMQERLGEDLSTPTSSQTTCSFAPRNTFGSKRLRIEFSWVHRAVPDARRPHGADPEGAAPGAGFQHPAQRDRRPAEDGGSADHLPLPHDPQSHRRTRLRKRPAGDEARGEGIGRALHLAAVGPSAPVAPAASLGRSAPGKRQPPAARPSSEGPRPQDTPSARHTWSGCSTPRRCNSAMCSAARCGASPPRTRTPASMLRRAADSVRFALPRKRTRRSATASFACWRA